MIHRAGLLPDALVPGTSITTVACTLAGGTATTCWQITVRGEPADHA